MLRLVLLSLGAALLYVSGAQAHGYHAGCAVGSSRLGNGPHYHPGGYGSALPCGGGGGGYGGGYRAPVEGPEYGGGYGGGYYEEAPPPPPPDYYGGGGGYYRRGYGGGGRPGDYGPQTNRGQDCYNIGGQRICCPKGWTVQGGQCAPYRGR